MKSIFTLLPLVTLAHSQEYQAPLGQEDIAPIRPLTSEALSLLGFGTWRLTENTSEAVSWAIQTGYRHIDCAAAYGNEADVGAGIRDGLSKTGLTRDDLWITSKLWNDHHGDADQVEAAIDESLEKLGLNYLNLYLMHWSVAKGSDGLNVIEYLDTWAAMEELVDKGKTRHIGVANFSPREMQNLLKHSTSHPPQVHQMELHPYLQQTEFVKWHQDLGIHVTAYSPFAGTNPIYDPDDDDAPTPLLDNSVVKEIADDRDCTPAQVAIMWGLARGTSVIPKSKHKSYITENFHSLECILQDDDFDKLEELGEEHFRYNNPSKSWDVVLYEGLEDSKGKHREDE